MLLSVLNSIKKHFTRRNLLFIAIIFTALFMLSDTSFAVTNPSTQPTTPPTDSNVGVKTLDQGIKGVAVLLSVLTSLVTLFLHPGWYNGDIFDINVYLKQIWILISNIVYFIFAILLVWIALMNIIGKGGDYELKKQLPKFIVGILIVPFSWFIVQFMLSLSSVLTVAVLTLPYDSFKDFEGPKSFMQNIKIPKKCTISIGGNTNTSNNGGGKSSKGGINCDEDGQTIYEMFSGGNSGKGPQQSVFGIMAVYTYGILDMGAASQISTDQVTSIDGIKSILNLGLKMAFSVFFIIVYIILLFALFLALFVRGVQLWIYMMISPLFGLFYYFGGSVTKLGKLSNFNLSNFIGLAMMPVYVSAALSFGLLFIGVVDYGMQKSGNNTEMVKCTGNGANQECSLKLGGFDLVVKGALGKENTNGKGGLGGSPIGYLIMQMFAIVVLWTSVMAALKTSKLTESVIQPFEHFGEHVGGAIQKLPQYMPIPGTGGFNASSLQHIGSDLGSKLEEVTTKQYRDFRDGSPFLKGLRPENESSTDAAKKIVDGIKNNNVTDSDLRAHTKEMFNGLKDFKNIPQKNQEATKSLAGKVGVNLDGLKLDTEDGFVNAWRKISETEKGRDIIGTKFTSTSTPKDILEYFEGHKSTPQTPPNPQPVVPTIEKNGGKVIINNNNPITIDQNFNSNGQFTNDLKAKAGGVFKDEAALKTALEGILKGEKSKDVIANIINEIKKTPDFYNRAS